MNFISFFKSQKISDSLKAEVFQAEVMKINSAEKNAWILYQEEKFLISLVKSPFLIFPKLNSFIDVLAVSKSDVLFKGSVYYYPLHFYAIDSVYFDGSGDLKDQKPLFSANKNESRKNI